MKHFIWLAGFTCLVAVAAQAMPDETAKKPAPLHTVTHVDLDSEYRYAVVGHPSRKYLWILSRTRTMDPSTYAGILERLTAQGYDIGKLRVTLQPPEPAAP